MNRKSLIDSVAEKFELKRGKSRKIVDHILIELLEAGLSGEGFSSPILRVASKEVEEKVVNTSEGIKTVPARQVMRIIKSKPYERVADKTASENSKFASVN